MATASYLLNAISNQPLVNSLVTSLRKKENALRCVSCLTKREYHTNTVRDSDSRLHASNYEVRVLHLLQASHILYVPTIVQYLIPSSGEMHIQSLKKFKGKNFRI